MQSELPKGSVAAHFCRLLRVDLMLVYQRELGLVHVITMLLLTEVLKNWWVFLYCHAKGIMEILSPLC